jgi:hypothetical protein
VDVPFHTAYANGDPLSVGTSGDNWSATWDANNHQIDLQANSGGDLLGTDEWVSVNFTATSPGDTGTYTFDTTAWLNTDYSGTEDTLDGSEPQVNVTSPDWGSSNADADSWVEQNNPNNNYDGSSPFLHVKFQQSDEERITYIKFDLSGLSLPSGDGYQTVVDSAVLYLYRYADEGAPSAYSISDDSWTETGITWNNKPAVGGLVADGQLSDNLCDATQWLAWSITDYVQSECDGDQILTVAIKFPDQATDDVHHADFRSDEYGSESYDPYLAINCKTVMYGGYSITGPRVLTIDVLGRVVRVPVGADGRTMAAAEVLSPNGEVLLVVPEGTRVLNPDGSLVPKIEVLPAGTPLPPAGASIVSAFQFLPSGITFDPEITVIITYDPLKVPAGAVLVFAYYDEIAGKWVEQETAGYIVGGTVVPDAVTSHISHFTYFALLAKSG